MDRDLSPSAFVAPGPALIGLSVILSAASDEPLPIDQLLSNYSPSFDGYVNFASGWQTLVSLIPSLDTNARVIIIILPRANATAVTLKGVTGDTGIPMNANGWAVIPITSAAATWGVTAGAGITGVRVIIA